VMIFTSGYKNTIMIFSENLTACGMHRLPGGYVSLTSISPKHGKAVHHISP